MNIEIEQRLNGLSSRVYTYSIDIISFVKSLQKAGYKDGIISSLAVAAGDFTNIVLDLEDLTDKNEILADLKKSANFADRCLNHLRKVDCKEAALLNEKSDLAVETFNLIQEIKGLINSI